MYKKIPGRCKRRVTTFLLTIRNPALLSTRCSSTSSVHTSQGLDTTGPRTTRKVSSVSHPLCGHWPGLDIPYLFRKLPPYLFFPGGSVPDPGLLPRCHSRDLVRWPNWISPQWQRIHTLTVTTSENFYTDTSTKGCHHHPNRIDDTDYYRNTLPITTDPRVVTPGTPSRVRERSSGWPERPESVLPPKTPLFLSHSPRPGWVRTWTRHRDTEQWGTSGVLGTTRRVDSSSLPEKIKKRTRGSSRPDVKKVQDKSVTKLTQ